MKDDSAAQIGTSKASMNRCGKTNAAKGVHNHYNEYKDFHSREVEGHVCASFMMMCGMSKMNGKQNKFIEPEQTHRLRGSGCRSIDRIYCLGRGVQIS